MPIWESFPHCPVFKKLEPPLRAFTDPRFTDPSIGPGFDNTIAFFNNNTGNNENAKTRQYSRIKDTFDYRKNLCYEYKDLLFYGLTPQKYIDVHQKNLGKNCLDLKHRPFLCVECCQIIDKDGQKKNGPRTDQGKEHCDNVCTTGDGDFALLSAGVVLPKSAPTGSNRLNICQKDTCVEGGRLGIFGGAPGSSNDYEWLRPSLIDDKYYRLQEVDVTGVVAKQGWNISEPFVVRMMEETWGKLPDPVFIEKRLGKDFLI